MLIRDTEWLGQDPIVSLSRAPLFRSDSGSLWLPLLHLSSHCKATWELSFDCEPFLLEMSKHGVGGQ